MKKGLIFLAMIVMLSSFVLGQVTCDKHASDIDIFVNTAATQSNGTFRADFCPNINSNQAAVIEAFCETYPYETLPDSNEYIVFGYYACPTDYQCLDGACVPVTEAATTPEETPPTETASEENLPSANEVPHFGDCTAYKMCFNQGNGLRELICYDDGSQCERRYQCDCDTGGSKGTGCTGAKTLIYGACTQPKAEEQTEPVVSVTPVESTCEGTETSGACAESGVKTSPAKTSTCFDSDNMGLGSKDESIVKGTVKGRGLKKSLILRSKSYDMTDYCLNSQQLIEYSCSNGKTALTKRVECRFGCKDGACKSLSKKTQACNCPTCPVTSADKDCISKRNACLKICQQGEGKIVAPVVPVKKPGFFKNLFAKKSSGVTGKFWSIF